MYPEIKIAIYRSGKRGYEVAADLGWSASKLSQVISGIHRANADEKRKVAGYFGQPVGELFSARKREEVEV